ncbi:transcription repressor OFP7-like isoform X2 [Rutidosis leptorrhynchoides]|uniref:transcription repressor OFP7-like isoform X2 n=1 Tax=Rutidosis leptorrhynchoides TaxID=125765 RepID=UPI003A9A4BA0
MAKFKLRFFHSCRSKDNSTLPNHPVPVFQRHTPPTTTTVQPPSKHLHHQQPHRSSFKSHVSSAFGCGSKSGNHSDSDSYFQWQEEDKWHVVAKIYDVESPRRKIYNSSVSEIDTDDDSVPLPLPLPLPLLPLEKKKRRRCRKLKIRNNISSTSSGEDAVENDTETETLISSSRSFSTDTSTDFNPQLETIRESAPVSYKLIKKKKKKQSKGRVTSSEWGTPARLSVFKKMIPCKLEEGKMKESFAVVKRSENPYDDFKVSSWVDC